mmetsp:Transcript_34472/g.61994  ORF Transcript_34472/g.61994 Transcript_34472/m.61994 type:complete len:977 (-) Transcript_34472:155-3085(-)
MTSASTWRSPLSILMGARRNDDDDLELREDYFRPTPPPPKSPAAENVEQQQSRSNSLPVVASYNPFSYFGLTSPAPVLAAADDRHNNIIAAAAAAATTYVNVKENGHPVPPPRGAFPPPISAESPTGHNEGGHHDHHGGDEDFLDEREQQQGANDHPFVSSHPWFNQLELTDSNHHRDHSNNQPNDQPKMVGTKDHTAKKEVITWTDQKAIIGTTFNFANSIIGAGAMGLGGAFAASGGGISVLCLIGFAILTKSSLDLVVDLSSCPSVIRKARSQDEDRDRKESDCDSSIGISSSCSESFSGELDSNGLSTHESNTSHDTSNIFDDAIDGSYNDGSDQPNQDGSPPNNETTKDVEVAGDELSQKAANNDSSPLMAEEGQEEDDETGDAFQTPKKTRGLGIDHPLTQSPELLNEKDRYDSLTMGVTQPKFFSPLHLNTDGFPVVKSTPSILNENPIQHQTQGGTMAPCTYEELGRAAFGTTGRLLVLASKALYSFGCLIAYVVVVRDNFGLALRRIIVGPTSPNVVEGDEGHGWLYDDDFLAFWVSAIFILPLSCPRTMKPLAKFSFLSILSIMFLIVVVAYLFVTCTNPEGGVTSKASFYQNWIQIRSFSGFVESLGCFVFTFVCHHTVNLAYESLPPPIRNPKIWRRVSTNSIALALEASLAIGVFAYLTFGSQTPADVLMGYPADLTLANIARLLLCLTMVLSFPLPFLTCREMSILICVDMHKFYHVHDLERINIFRPIFACCTVGASSIRTYICRRKKNQQFIQSGDDADAAEGAEFVQMQRPSFFRGWGWTRRGFGTTNVGFSDLNEEWLDEMNGDAGHVTQALLSEEEHQTAIMIGGQLGKPINPSPLSSRSGDASSSETTISAVEVPTPSWILPNGDGRQLSLLWHAALTFTIWLVVTICAIKSPSLGDVLDLVGAFTGTLLVFVLPALFSFKLKGYSHLSLVLLVIGGVVGLLGTIFSFVKFTKDMR